MKRGDSNALTEARTQIREALGRLNARERNMLIAGIALVTLTLIWLLFGWQAKTRQELDLAVPRAGALLARMQTESAELARLRSLQTPAAADLTQLSTTLASTANARGLALTVRNDGNQLVVSGKGINFDTWTQWIAETQRASAIRLTYVDVTQASGGAQIEARLAPL